jgi:hypothetical protein
MEKYSITFSGKVEIFGKTPSLARLDLINMLESYFFKNSQKLGDFEIITNIPEVIK